MTTKIPPILASLLLVLATLAGFPTSAGAATPAGILNDFEGGEPPGWFVYNGGASTVATATTVVAEGAANARPDQVGDNTILESTFTIGDFGGFGQDQNIAFGAPQDWSQTGGMSFWFLGTGSGLAYQAEISDNRSDPGTDTAERFDYTFTDDTAGWRLIEIPWADFSRATDFQPGGAPDDGLTLTEMWAWAIVLPGGTDTVAFDDITLLEGNGGGGGGGGGVTGDIVEDFESGLPSGTDADGIPVGYYTFQGAASSAALSTVVPATPVPDSAADNDVLNIDFDVTAYAGFINAFTNDSANEWVSQDWSTNEGISFWINGTGSGTQLFFDVLDNRNAGSTSEDAQRWTVEFADTVAGWRQLQFPFSSFTEKGVGNGAPQDGFDRTEVHGFALGALGTGGPLTIQLDNVAVYGQTDAPGLSVGFAGRDFATDEGSAASIVVKLNRPLGSDDPASVTVDYSFESLIAEPGVDFDPVPDGSLTFTAGGPTEQTITVQTIDDNTYEVTERLIVRLANAQGAALSTAQATVTIDDNDPYDPRLLDDFEGSTVGWVGSDSTTLNFMEVNAGDPMARPGQTGPEGVLSVTAPQGVQVGVIGGMCEPNTGKNKNEVELVIFSSSTFDATTIDPSSLDLAGAGEYHPANKNWLKKHSIDVNDDGLKDLVAHFKLKDTDPGTELDCSGQNIPLQAKTTDGQEVAFGSSTASVTRNFPISQDWSNEESVSFWYKGSGTGEQINFDLLDNRNPDMGSPDTWGLAWADEFDGDAGSLPDPTKWDYEIGDGSYYGIPGWGNSELQYYTNDPANVSLNGNGQLGIRLLDAPDGLDCYYGPCDYTSARLVTTNRAEFAYGRIEARVQVPDGPDGLWPAVWSLGTDIDRVTWPQTGEIDIMEYVSRIPNEVFGTIHGPGYSGGSAYGNTQTIDGGVAGTMRTYAIEWKPNEIKWFVDGTQYHSATPGDIDPNQWVFNDPVYLLMNMAIGGNFGGPVSPELTFPQEMTVDYVRAYQPADTAERFEASFVDATEGWTQITIPLSDFVRSADQPANAPDDGLTLTEVWGYGFSTPEGTGSGTFTIDEVRLVPVPAPTEITVTTTDQTGPGSINDALSRISAGGTITVDPAIAGSTINLNTPLTVTKPVTIVGNGVTFDGGATTRVLTVEQGGEATINNVNFVNGYGWQIGGCAIVNGTLTANEVSFSDCVMATDAGDFWQGGGGVYVGSTGRLTLNRSTVANNTSGFAGGGVYGFFDAQITINDSTLSGNSAADVGGGLRSLTSASITNSTFSGNSAGVFQGNAIFQTDGVMTILNSTIADNTGPDGSAALVVATFTDSNATVNIANSLIGGSANGPACTVLPYGSGAVALNSGGYNLAADATCNPTGTDPQPQAPGLGPLADNGGPTLTHLPNGDSPAVDAGATGCPANDQRGEARSDGSCDIGAVEVK